MAARTDTRNRMIAGATALMRQRGFSATSFKDVWELSGTPRGSVYHHFPHGKEELGRAVIDDALGTLLRWTAEAQEENDSAASFVRGLAGKLAQFLTDSGYEQGCPIASIAIEAPTEFPGLRPSASDAFRRWTDRIAAALVGFGVQQRGAHDTAVATAAALEGAILVSKADGTTAALELTADLIATTPALQSA